MKQINPIQNLFSEIEKILNFIEIKNNKLAMENETEHSSELAGIWINAKRNDDTYLTYAQYWDTWMFQSIQPNVKLNDIIKWKNNPYELPLKFRDKMYEFGKDVFLNSYKETNDYYLMLTGNPSIDDKEFIYPSKSLQSTLKFPNQPIHELSDYWQNIYIKTEEYKNVLNNNPNKLYLKYLGINKIDLYKARVSYDFDIIRYPYNISNINPNLLNVFYKIYSDCREYVCVVLYNKHLEDIHPGYRDFMGFLIMAYTLMQISNKSINTLKTWNFFDDSILYHLMTLYKIPTNIQMTKEVRRMLARSIPSLIKKKATDDIYDDIINILDYQGIKVNKLILYKNNSNLSENVKFLKLNIKDKNPYKSLMNKNIKSYDYNKITDKDIYWINSDDVKRKINNGEYNISDSKYITLDVEIQQSKFMMESILFPRMILDNKSVTDKIMINLYPIFNYDVSLFDLVLFLLFYQTHKNRLNGTLIYETDEPISIYSFNFDINIEELKSYINQSKYINKNKILQFIDSLYIISKDDISRVFNNILAIHDWFERMIMFSINRKECIEYMNVFKALFTYDICNHSYLNDFKKPMELIKEEFNISNEELDVFKYFYPHTENFKSITIKDYNGNKNTTRYSYPFLSVQKPIDWYINIPDRGNLYFFDILNCDNCLLLTNPDGTRLFMDYESEEAGWIVNSEAINKALITLESLPDDGLKDAYFQINTRNPEGKVYDEKTLLPKNIRYGLYKTILIEKFKRDTNGLSEKPRTIDGFMSRKNQKFLYDTMSILNTDDKVSLDTINIFINKIETVLDMHLKYYKQSIVSDLSFFQPLIELIKRFKSNRVEIIDINHSHIFDDKIDSSGLAVLKLFDECGMKFQLKSKDELGLYDVEKSLKFKIQMNDRSEMLTMVFGDGFLAEKREIDHGSIRLTDEVKFKKNGKDIDPDNQHSHWIAGESNAGIWDQDFEHLMKIRKGNTNIKNNKYDLDGWKEYIPSYNG